MRRACTMMVALCAWAAAARADEEPWVAGTVTAAPAFDEARARALYDDRCRLCHGRTGNGRGAVARDLDPAPRDFTRGIYKFRSTPSGELPTDADLFESITRGMAGTAMPSWRGLSPDDRWQLVLLLESFSPRFRERPRPQQVLATGAAPPSSPERVAQGSAVYVKMKCASCHGEDGRGFGPSSLTLRDDQGARAYPFNLTHGRDYRGGSSAEEIYRAFMTGLDGTPMPSYADSLTRDEAWSLVHFVRSLFADPPR